MSFPFVGTPENARYAVQDKNNHYRWKLVSSRLKAKDNEANDIHAFNYLSEADTGKVRESLPVGKCQAFFSLFEQSRKYYTERGSRSCEESYMCLGKFVEIYITLKCVTEFMNQHIVAVFTMNLREIENLAPQGECLVNSNWNRGEYVFDIKKGDSSIFLWQFFFWHIAIAWKRN